MQVENDYDKDVYNGDLGVVSRIDLEEGELHADFDGRAITYAFGELDELVLAYATTIHKSPRIGIPSRRHSPQHPALPDAAAESRLYRGDARQTPGGTRWAVESVGYCGQRKPSEAALVEVRELLIATARPNAPF
jgi:hypothetical protein